MSTIEETLINSDEMSKLTIELNNSIKFNDFAKVQKLFEMNVKPDSKTFDLSLLTGNIDLIKFVYDNGGCFTLETGKIALSTKNISIIDFVFDKNVNCDLQYFKDLFKIENLPDERIVDFIVDNSTPKILKIALKCGAKLSINSLTNVIIKKNCEMIRTIFENTNVKPNIHLVNTAIETENIEIIELLLEKKCVFSTNSLEIAIKTRNLTIVNFCIDHGCKYTDECLLESIKTGNVNIFVAVFDMDENEEKTISEECLIEAVKTREFNLIEIVFQIILEIDTEFTFSNRLKKQIVYENDDRIIDFMVSNGMLFNLESFDIAMRNHNIDLIHNILDFRLKPTSQQLNNVIKFSDYKILNILIDKKMAFIDENTLDIAIETCDLYKIETVFKLGAKVSEWSLNSAIDTNNLEITKFLYSKGAKPNESSINYALDVNNIDILKFVIECGARVSQTTPQYTVAHSNLEITKYMVDYMNVNPQSLLPHVLDSSTILKFLLERGVKIPDEMYFRYGKNTIYDLVLAGFLSDKDYDRFCSQNEYGDY